MFIANRGEIATRIARTADRLGMTSIAPATDGREALDLLDIDAVVAAARATNADAIHPGFGFLAENAAFAEAVTAAGIAWVGPPPGAIRAMGDKAAARRLAASLGIPTIAGYDDADQSDEALTTAAQRIGTPLLIKPAAGGGGKGMRTVRDPGRLSAELAAARREARTAFGDDRLILERLIEGARHVEIQVLFDRAESGVHLGERDCSVQRRHQKVLEEAGSPAVDGALRERMGEAALSVGTSGRLRRCRDLRIPPGRPRRLHVPRDEHAPPGGAPGHGADHRLGISSRTSCGSRPASRSDWPRTMSPSTATRSRSACMPEDAEAGFLPATGRVERLRWPAGDGIRVDAGIAEGDEVTGRFDPMLAKIIAHGRDRGRRARPTDGRARLDRGAGPDDEPSIPALARARARRSRWRGPDEHARSDLAAGRLGGADGRARGCMVGGGIGVDRNVRRARAAEPSWAGGWRLNGPPSARVLAEDEVRQVTAMTSRRRDLPPRSSTSCASATPSTWTSPAAVPRSASPHRPTWIAPPEPPRAVAPPARSTWWRRCPAESSRSTCRAARPSPPGTRSSPSRP
ncbi:MAG: biotin carboxylase N-terminal domain-containing protein [Candidatus Limnocylindrales bacterium]